MGVFGDLAEMGAGALELVKHTPVGAAAVMGYHGLNAGYHAISGDRNEAINHGSEAVWAGLGAALPGLGLAMGAGGLVSKMAADDSHLPSPGAWTGMGLNYVIDDHFGKEDPGHKSSHPVLGTMGALLGLPFGIPAMVAGGLAGHKLGEIGDGFKEKNQLKSSGLDMGAVLAAASHYAD